jgi:hypothetical protein
MRSVLTVVHVGPERGGFGVVFRETIAGTLDPTSTETASEVTTDAIAHRPGTV